MQGVSDILDGGLTQFLTDSGMQSCDVTGFQKRSETVYILFTSCGRGRLVLQQQSQQETQGMRRKLYFHDQSPFVGGLVTFSYIWGDTVDYYGQSPCQSDSTKDISESLKFYGSLDSMSFWICDTWNGDWYATQYTNDFYCPHFDMIFDLNRIEEDLRVFSWISDAAPYCVENESVLSVSLKCKKMTEIKVHLAKCIMT